MVASDVRGPYRAPLRLTRRGRAVVLVLAVLLAAVSSAVLFAGASRAAPPAGGSAPVADAPGRAAGRAVSAGTRPVRPVGPAGVGR